VTLGVFKDGADQNLTVNGTIVDPTKAYAAALTDYLPSPTPATWT